MRARHSRRGVGGARRNLPGVGTRAGGTAKDKERFMAQKKGRGRRHTTPTIVEETDAPTGSVSPASSLIQDPLQKRLSQALLQASQLQEQVDSLQTEVKAKTEYTKALQRNYDTVAELCTRLVRDNKQLKEDVVNAEEMARQLEQHEEDTSALRAQVNDLEKQNSHLSDLQAAQDRQHVLDVATVDDLKGRLSRVTDEKLDAIQHMKRAQRMASAKSEELRQLLDRIERDNFEAKLEASQAEVGLAKEALQSLQAEMAELQQRNEELGKLQQRTENMLSRKDLEIDNLTHDVKVEQEHVQRLQRTISAQQKEVDRHKETAATVRLELQAAQSELRLSRHSLSSTKERLGQADTASDFLRSQLTESRAVAERLQEEVQGLNSQLDEANKGMQELNSIVARLREQEALHSAHEQSVQSLHDMMDAQAKTAEDSRKQLRDERDAARAEVDRLKTDIKVVLRQLDKAQKKNEELHTIVKNNSFTKKQKAAVQKGFEELQVAMAKLVVVEKAAEGAYTCSHCVKAFTDPVTCVPCGHNYCRGCIQQLGRCQLCGGSGAPTTYHSNSLLGGLTAKFVFRKQALASITRMAQSLSKFYSPTTAPSELPANAFPADASAAAAGPSGSSAATAPGTPLSLPSKPSTAQSSASGAPLPRSASALKQFIRSQQQQ